jgi:hypothetical protein
MTEIRLQIQQKNRAPKIFRPFRALTTQVFDFGRASLRQNKSIPQSILQSVPQSIPQSIRPFRRRAYPS